ncbi:hypothetical protein ACWEQC_19795 [Streptomyces shenzhenensis]
MIAAAAVLGIVAGACAGYLIQADREPTELPSLSQPVLERAEGEVEALSAAQDRLVKTDGDLRKLLVSRPKGAGDGFVATDTDGWLDQAAYADAYESPVDSFNYLADSEFRRAARTAWREGDTYGVEIILVQFRQERELVAPEQSENGRYWAEKKDNTRSWAIPGTGDGRVYVHDTPVREPGYAAVYSAEAHAWRGDIAMEIWVHDVKPITKSKLITLANRQMENL